MIEDKVEAGVGAAGRYVSQLGPSLEAGVDAGVGVRPAVCLGLMRLHGTTGVLSWRSWRGGAPRWWAEQMKDPGSDPAVVAPDSKVVEHSAHLENT